MITKVEGFIVNEVNYGESSKVINVLTKDFGLLGIMCKGVKSMKSRLRALTLRFTYGFFYIYKKEGKLSFLRDVDVINPLTHIHSNITLLSYCSYLTELTQQVYKESEDARIYPLFLDCILKLEQGLDPLVLTNILEVKYLHFLGVGLNLDACVSCGSTNQIITIDPDAGGYLCQKCVQNERIVSIKTVKMLRMYYYVELKSITKLNVSEIVKKEINEFLNRYYDRYTGMFLKSKEFLDKISKLDEL